MTSLPERVQKQLKEGASIFERASTEGGYTYTYVDLDCGNLPKPRWIKTPGDWPAEIYEAGLLPSFFDKLPDNEPPCLYRFESLNLRLQDVLEPYRAFQSQFVQHTRATAALKKRPPTEGSTLYVGKVKRDIRGRLAVHLGYYHVGKTAGLQLACWAKEIGLQLRLHVFAFQSEMAPFVSSLELEFSRNFNPMIGKQ